MAHVVTAHAASARDDPPRLQVSNLSKRFGGATVLDAVNLEIRPGEIHGLLGQNGSGKSTIIKVLAGYHTPERESEIRIDGRQLHLPARPSELIERGVSFVHQDLGLLDELSVAENVCVGHFRRGRWTRRIDWREIGERTASVLGRFGVELDPHRPVSELMAGHRAIVALARGLVRQREGSGLIVLDEATRALPEHSRRDVHAVLRRIAADGGAVLVVSHDLGEVLALADRVTVLRDGQVVAGGASTATLGQAELAGLMLGYAVGSARRPAPPTDSIVLSVRGLVANGVHGMNLDLAAGEVVGVTGLAGAGCEQIPYLLAGAVPARAGTVEVLGARYEADELNVRSMRRAGVALVPERRDRDGVALTMSVADNVTLPRLRDRGRRYFVGNGWRNEEADAVITQLAVRPPSPDRPVAQLSGGNQQKIVLGKCLMDSPRLLLLHEPTQGVDIGARGDILEALRLAAEEGAAILIASLDAGELAGICHRVLVFEQGQVRAEIRSGRRDDIIGAVYRDDAGHATGPEG